MSEDTDIITKKSPVLMAVLVFVFKRLETIIIAAVLAGVAAYYNHQKESHDVKWIGDNLHDKTVKIQQIQQGQTNDTSTSSK